MRRPLSSALLIAAVAVLGGCAFIPKDYARLDEARSAREQTLSDARVARWAPVELGRAEEALERARIARDTLDDSAVVDHLAYVAKQRFAIARATAEWRASLATIELSEPGHP
jgi:outer membrane lipopolysaccharide assembly protein LptE/RlpB